MKVLMLTVLNPCLHARIYYKEAQSLQQAGFGVYNTGYSTYETKPYKKNNVIIIPHPLPKRFSFKRIRLYLKFFSLILRIKPKIIHFHTPELIPMLLVVKLWVKTQFIYDVHEDYAANFKYGKTVPYILKPFLILYVKLLEFLSIKLLNSNIIFSEKKFFQKNSRPNTLLLENFVKLNTRIIPPVTTNPYLLYTGTLGEDWGIKRLLEIWTILSPKVRYDLVIAGFSYSEAISQYLLNFRNKNKHLRLVYLGITEAVPYQQILGLIKQCVAGFALYAPTPTIQDRIPTKFYEYMAFRKPLFFTQTDAWCELNALHHFGIAIPENYSTTEATELILNQICDNFTACYPHEIPPSAYDWEYQAQKLVEFYQSILQNNA